MADINQIVSKQAIQGIITTDESITRLDKTTKDYIVTIEKLARTLQKEGISLKELNAAQKRANEEKERLKQNDKELTAAEKALEKQRQRGLAVMAKQEAKERELTAAINKEVKSEQDLIAKTNALVAVRKRLDTTTEKGRAEHARLTAEIKKNTLSLKNQDKQISRNQRNVGNYKSALEGLKGSFAVLAVGVAAVIGVFSKFNKFIQSAIDKTDIQQLAEVSLATALGYVSKELLNQASALQTLTRFGDEEIIRGQSFLAQMGLTEEQILKITPAILDFAQAKGIDLKTASDLVAKSVGSETNALSRYGIQIEGAAGSSERMASALDALNSKFEGQAAAALVGKGALVQLGNTIGDVLERVGKYITDGINPMIRGLNSLITIRDKESEALITEQEELNHLVSMITNANTSQKIRRDLITDLQEMYPNFLKNLNTESVTNKELAARLVDVNEQYKLKIAAVIMDEKLQKVNEKIAQTYRDELHQLELLAKAELKKNKVYRDQNTKTHRANIERIKKTREERELERDAIVESVNALFGLSKANEEYITDGQLLAQKKAAAIKKAEEERIALAEKSSKEQIELEDAITENLIEEFDRRTKAAEKAAKDAAKAARQDFDAPEEADAEDDDFLKKLGTRNAAIIEQARNLAAQQVQIESIKNEEIEALYAAGQLTDEEYNALKVANAKDTWEKIQSIAETAVSIINDALYYGVEIYNNTLEAKSIRLDEQREKELLDAEGDKIAQAKINEKYDKKDAEIKTKQAKAEKKAALITAGMNVALSLIASLVRNPLPVGLPFLLLNAAFGALQIAAIASKPIPKFFKGTESAPAGVISVGEKGKELIRTKSGQTLLANDPALVSGLEGAKIYTNKETERILSDRTSPQGGSDPAMISELIQTNKMVASALSKQTHNHFYPTHYVKRSGNYTENYRNKKLKGLN